VAATVTFTLSESSTDFVLGDITVTGGALLNFTGSGTVYTGTFTPAANSTQSGVVSIASGKFSDAAGNQNNDGAELNNIVTMSVDTIVPAVAITSNKTALKAGEAAMVTFTLSESSTDFVLGDVTATGGALSNFTGSGTSYTGTFTPAANSTADGLVSVASSKFSDVAGNQNNDGAELNNTVTMSTDTVLPTIAIASSKAALTAGEIATVSFTLSEASTDFVLGDVTVTGGALSNFTGAGTSYTATFTPAVSSTANGVVSVASSKFSDAAGNQNADGGSSDNAITMAIDTVLPTISITSNKNALRGGSQRR
jgi:hypothetical protein